MSVCRQWAGGTTGEVKQTAELTSKMFVKLFMFLPKLRHAGCPSAAKSWSVAAQYTPYFTQRDDLFDGNKIFWASRRQYFSHSGATIQKTQI